MSFLAPFQEIPGFGNWLFSALYIWYCILLLLLGRAAFLQCCWSLLVLYLILFFPLSGLSSIYKNDKQKCLRCQLAVLILKKLAEEREGSFWLMWALCVTLVLPGTSVSVKHQGDFQCCLTNAVLIGQVGKSWGRRKCTCIEFKELNQAIVPADLLRQ